MTDKVPYESPEELRDLLNSVQWPAVSVSRDVTNDEGETSQEIMFTFLVCPNCSASVWPTPEDESDTYRFREAHIEWEVNLYQQIQDSRL